MPNLRPSFPPRDRVLPFADNGPGISPEIADRIFELTISSLAPCPSPLFSLDGRRKGANFLVRFPRKKSRATIYKSEVSNGSWGANGRMQARWRSKDGRLWSSG